MPIESSFKNETLAALLAKSLNWQQKLDVNKFDYAPFVEACKVIIDWGEDIENGFILEFSSDYTTIRKRENRIINEKQEIKSCYWTKPDRA